MYLKNSKGFTLIELLITIALLAVISIISFVSINAIINKNKDNECNTIVNNITLAVKEYVSDNRYDGIDTNITVQNLLDGNYLSSEIINPYTKETVDGNKIKIYIELYSDSTIKNIAITDLDGEEIFNGCRVHGSGGMSGRTTTTKKLSIEYEINYILNGGTLGSKAPSSVNLNTIIQIDNPSKKITLIGHENTTEGANGTGVTIGNNNISVTQGFTGWTSGSAFGLGENAIFGPGSNPTNAWQGEITTYKYFRNLRDSIGTVTLVANWNVQSHVLPKVTKAGYVCGWSTSKNGTTIEYSSEENYSIDANISKKTLDFYAVCNPTYQLTLNKNGATNTPTASVSVGYNTNAVEPSSITLPQKNIL